MIRRFDIRRVRHNTAERVIDEVAVEEPLEIRLSYRFKDALRTESLAVTMRTPGHDRELAAGYLLSEGIVHQRADIEALRELGTGDSSELIADLASHIDVEAWKLGRASYVSASCGVCGKRSRDAIQTNAQPLPHGPISLSYASLARWPDLLAQHQSGFEQTGSLHAAALLNSGGELLHIFEDIGRHNALDKLFGHCLLEGLLPLHRFGVIMSSRSSFELVQKAAHAGLPILATVGGPSSLAIEAARDLGLTLVGFLRPGRANVYSGEWRLHS